MVLLPAERRQWGERMRLLYRWVGGTSLVEASGIPCSEVRMHKKPSLWLCSFCNRDSLTCVWYRLYGSSSFCFLLGIGLVSCYGCCPCFELTSSATSPTLILFSLFSYPPCGQGKDVGEECYGKRRLDDTSARVMKREVICSLSVPQFRGRLVLGS